MIQKKRVTKYHGKFKNTFFQQAAVKTQSLPVLLVLSNMSDLCTWPRSASGSDLGLSFHSCLLGNEYIMI